mgnify:CR=1 FL=1
MDSMNAVSVGLGIFVGMMMALTGAGGGILSVPLLVFGLNLSVASAGPIGLLAKIKFLVSPRRIFMPSRKISCFLV